MGVKQTRNYLLLCVLFFSLDLLATATSRFGNLETMNLSEGLNNSTVNDVVRDQRGFVWLSTDMGLSRYDGFHFRNFPFLEKSATNQSLAVHAISKVYPDFDGLLYLQLLQGKLACFNSSKETFLPVEFNRSMENEKINSLYIANKHVMYVATDKALYVAEVKHDIEDKTGTVQIVLNETPLLKGDISHLCSDDQGNLFFVQNHHSVVHYSMGTRLTKPIADGASKNSPVSCLYADGDHLWICRKWEEPVLYDFKRAVSRRLSDMSEAGAMHLSETYVTGITRTDASNYYLSTWNGLFGLKFDSGNLNEALVAIEHITQKEQIHGTEVETKMTSLLWDDLQNTLWVGTFGGGAMKVNFNENVYIRLAQQMNVDFNGIVEDSRGYVWLATQRKGIWRTTTNSLSSSSLFVPWTKGVSPTESYCIYKDKNGCLWLGDEHAGIVYLDPLTEETHRYQLTPAGTKNFSGNPQEFCLDSRGRLWVVTTQGIVLFNTATEASVLVFKPTSEIKEVFSIAEDKEGNIWVGTDVGLKRVEMQGKTVKMVGDYERQAGVRPDRVSSIYVNSYNQIFASYPGKVIRIDGRDKEKVESVFTLATGLNSGHIFCMIDDNNGNTWIGSNSGIMTIRNDRTFFYGYSATGCCAAVCRLRDGRLLWTDSWGLVFFDPLMVKNHKSRKKLLLSDIWVNGKSIAVGEEINGRVILSSTPDCQDKFVFSVANKEMSFYFSDLQYGMMQRKLVYRLLPDEEWKAGSLEDGVHYSHLKSGKYTLQVKLIYPDASEGDMLEIPIVVRGYWWSSIWAFIGYFLLFVGLCIAGYYYLLHKDKKKLQSIHSQNSLNEEIEMVVPLEQKQSQRLDEMRSIIFARLMQEMRMPLSMIISPLRDLLQTKELSKGLSTKVFIAYRNSMGMKNACDQLLNIYGFVPSNAKIELASYSIVKVVDAFVYSMNEFLRVHPIQFQYEKKVSRELEVWMAKKDIVLVLQNLLYNAFIHIQYSGAVALLVQEIEEEGMRYCSIVVMDNAKSPVKTVEELSSDKEKLMQADYSEIEVGYPVMEQIMKEHHGSVSLKNLNGEGTRAQVKWPIDKSVFETDENVVFIESELQEEVVLPEGGALIKTMDQVEEAEIVEQVNAAPEEKTKKTILVVEDYSDIRLYLKTLFGKDYNILMAVNGEEGVNIARSELPDLILCDVMMPVKDGFECCKEIKEGLDTCHIPVIMVTAKVEEDDIIKGLEIGADDYILKPFIPQILKAKVKNLIEGRVNLKKMYTKLLVTPSEEHSEANDVETKVGGIDDPFINTVVKIIEENIQEPDFNVKKLASDLNMSQPTLYRRVKQCTDFTIIELIRGVRMKKAATLLMKKQNSVQEVAELIGYNDIPTFRKHFVDTYGTTPSTYADSNSHS